MNKFCFILYFFILSISLSSCGKDGNSEVLDDNITEYIEWIEVKNYKPKRIDINNDRKKITIDFNEGIIPSDVQIEFILAEGVKMIEPGTTLSSFDLTQIATFKIDYKGKTVSYTILANYLPEDIPDSKKGAPFDISLLYYGGSHRPTMWTNEQLEANVTHTDKDGNKHWLFDTFLFLEFTDGNGRYFESGFDGLPARKVEWANLIGKYMDPYGPMGRLNNQVGNAISELGFPKYKRQVIINLPAAIKGQKDWGELSGRNLDFSQTNDRIDACKWYVDNVIQQFKAGNFRNLELDGIYFVAEQLTNNREFLPAISEYIKSKGLKFYWIPYWGSDGMSEWKNMGFSQAYLQPNYFFPEVKPAFSHLTDVISYAFKYNMFLEMEFDERALRSSSDYRADRLRDYIKAFRSAGILKSMPIAYYQSDCMVYALKTSLYKEDRDLYYELCTEIVERQQNRGEK